MDYPPHVLDIWGQDFALEAQGIYYRNHYSEEEVLSDRKVWVPTLPEHGEETREIRKRKFRAATLASHAQNNETWCKSEFA